MLGLSLLGACGSELVPVAPPGAVAPGPDFTGGAAGDPGAPVHRVLFLHGFRGEPEQFERYWLAAVHLLPANCESYIVTGVHELMGALEPEGPERSTRDLEEFLQEHDVPLANLHLVAHSMGGLVARRFATLHPEAVRQVFLIGTPNGGVRMLHGLNTEGWCTPQGIGPFNERNPPHPDIRWRVVAGDFYDGPLGGAFWEGTPNDGLIATESVLSFMALCPEEADCESAVFPVIHPDWNWGESLLESPRIIDWVMERILADLERQGSPRPKIADPRP